MQSVQVLLPFKLKTQRTLKRFEAFSSNLMSAGPAGAISSRSQGGPSAEGEGVVLSQNSNQFKLDQVEKTLRDLIMNLRRRSGLRTALNFQGKAVRLKKNNSDKSWSWYDGLSFRCWASCCLDLNQEGLVTGAVGSLANTFRSHSENPCCN